MTTFWIAAIALTLVASAFLLTPVWTSRREAGRSMLGVVVAAAVFPAAVAIYLGVNSFDPNVEQVASGEDMAMVRQLADRLVENPEDVDGWALLGRSYAALGEYGLARQAFTEAYTRSEAPDAALKLSLGEAMILTEPSTARADAGDLIEQVLAAQPANQRALWWGGLVAVERNEPESARRRWTALLASNPPPDITRLLEQQLSMLPPPGGAGAEATADTGDGGPAPAAGPTLTLNVAVADGMPVYELTPGSRVFLFARAAGGGPPIVSRFVGPDELPGTFTLSDADAMLAGRSLGAFPELTVVARLSMSGNAIEQPGDLFGETVYTAGGETTLTLTIDEIVQPQ